MKKTVFLVFAVVFGFTSQAVAGTPAGPDDVTKQTTAAHDAAQDQSQIEKSALPKSSPFINRSFATRITKAGAIVNTPFAQSGSTTAAQRPVDKDINKRRPNWNTLSKALNFNKAQVVNRNTPADK